MTIKRCYPVIVGASVAENQLLDKDNYPASSGVFTNNGDGSVTANGLASSAETFKVASAYNGFILNHVYAVISGNTATGSSSTFEFMIIRFFGGEGNLNLYTEATIAKFSYTGSNNAHDIQAVVRSGYTANNLKWKPQIIDPTQKFGSSIADDAYTLEQVTAGSGITWLRSYGFLGGYKAYNTGSIESVEVTEKKAVGFNQWDEIIETGLYSSSGKAGGDAYWRCTNPVKIIPNKTYYIQAPSNVTLYVYGYSDADFNNGRSLTVTNHTVTMPNDVHYFAFAIQKSQYGSTYNNDICINLSNPDRNGEYEPYKSTSYPLGSDVLRGLFKLDANNNLYADGDRKEADGTITRKYGVVDLGTLSWNYVAPGGATARFQTNGLSSLAKKPPNNETAFNGVSALYSIDTIATVANSTSIDMAIGMYTSGVIEVRNSNYTNAQTFKTAMSGVYLVYEKPAATTEQSTSFTSPQIVYPDGTEEFVTENGVPVGHETEYQL